MSKCTCETFGECTTCRRPINYDSHRCVWCLEWFSTKNMFTVGNWKDNRKVCGPDCPKRPKRPQHRDAVKGNLYDVRVITRHSFWADDANSARRKAAAKMRDRLGIADITSTIATRRYRDGK